MECLSLLELLFEAIPSSNFVQEAMQISKLVVNIKKKHYHIKKEIDTFKNYSGANELDLNFNISYYHLPKEQIYSLEVKHWTLNQRALRHRRK